MTGASNQRLTVFIGGDKAGYLDRDASGLETFLYVPGYAGVPLSLSMPLSSSPYGFRVVRPYLQGLLPDGRAVRRSLGSRYGVSGENPLALLAHIGLDCPGAVQICPAGHDEDVLLRDEILVPVSDADIASRLRSLTSNAQTVWLQEGEHWSLGGAQEKFALQRRNGRWYRCEGSAATTHIFKPGVAGYEWQALNEYACMRLAAMSGLEAAQVSYETFEGQGAIVVERFDRRMSGRGLSDEFGDRGAARRGDGQSRVAEVVRLHQEDLCQALSVSPEQKYTSDGGPSTGDIVQLLATKTEPAAENVARFTAMLFFNYLVGAPDAHAKNYSVLFGEDGSVTLAPLYDVASAYPYIDDVAHTKFRLAMSIGGENRLGRLTKGGVRRYAELNGLDGPECISLMGNLAGRLLRGLDPLRDELAGIPGGNELSEKLTGPIERACLDMVAALS